MTDVGLAPPALEPFISVAELRAALGGEDIAALDDERAAWLCGWGSAAVRAEVAQIVNLVADDETWLDGNGSAVLLLPELECRAVHQVYLYDRQLEAGVDYDWNRAGALFRRARHRYHPAVTYHWPRGSAAVRVVYDHGWVAPSPQWEAARMVAMEVAARTYRNPGMLQSERIGDYSRSWVPRGSRGELTDAEKRSLDLLRRER